MHTTRTLLLALLFITSCDKTGPTATRTTSNQFPTLKEKTDFLQRYVTFRRTYETFDFDITYHDNGGGMVPGPSDWDVRLVAIVPASELPTWIPAGLTSSPQDRDWLKSIPTSLDLSGLNEWYGDTHRIIGIDREHHMIAYRNWKD
jgi:hypothetical protein